MSTILVQALPGVIPEAFCPTGENAEQQRYEMYLSLTQFSLAAGQTFFNYGNVVPLPENRVYPWFRSSGGYPDRWYQYAGGLWLARHSLPPGFTTIAPASITSAADLNTWDEGEAGVVGIYTGPFWEIDTDFDGRSPMGPGAIPTSNPAKTLAVGEAYGEGAHTQLTDEVGPHTHDLSHPEMVSSGGGASVGMMRGDSGNPVNNLTALTNTYAAPGTQQAMPVIHPVRGRYFIKRSGRLYFKV